MQRWFFVSFGYDSTPERFFDNGSIMANEIKKHMKMRISLRIDAGYTSQEVLDIFGFFDSLIGMRFHSIIFSMMTGALTIALIYDTKTAELLRKTETWPSSLLW